MTKTTYCNVHQFADDTQIYASFSKDRVDLKILKLQNSSIQLIHDLLPIEHCTPYVNDIGLFKKSNRRLLHLALSYLH